ncbi:MAG: DNA polymerase III subunit delta' [Pseudomonadota bacterium]
MDLFGEEPEEIIEETETDFSDAPVEETQGLVAPRLMSICIGHEKCEADLLERFKSGRMPHGLIFSGLRGIGKATFAYRFARFLLKQRASDPNQSAMFDDAPTEMNSFDVPSDDPVFRQVAAGGHADLLTVERDYDAAKDIYKDSVAVDAVRKVNPFLRMTASKDGGWRVVIIDDADTMNRSAQNALLKILEEPPANTVLILVCHRLGAMIPTIRSRAHTLSFNPLTEPAFERLLSSNGYDTSPAQLETLYQLSEGSIGVALEHIEQGGLDTLTQILGMLQSYPTWSWPEIHALAEELGRNGRNQSYKAFAELLPWVFSQMIKAKARGQNIASRALHIDAIETLHRQSSLESLLKICENLKSHFERAERSNLDKRQAVLGAFSIIAA